MSRSPRNIPPLARSLDMGGIMLLLAGAGCYTRAYVGMMGLRDGVAAGSPRFAGIREFDGYWQLSRIGLGVSALAVVVLIAAAVITWRSRRATAPGEPATT